jgi:hypothetical protein
MTSETEWSATVFAESPYSRWFQRFGYGREWPKYRICNTSVLPGFSIPGGGGAGPFVVAGSLGMEKMEETSPTGRSRTSWMLGQNVKTGILVGNSD